MKSKHDVQNPLFADPRFQELLSCWKTLNSIERANRVKSILDVFPNQRSLAHALNVDEKTIRNLMKQWKRSQDGMRTKLEESSPSAQTIVLPPTKTVPFTEPETSNPASPTPSDPTSKTRSKLQILLQDQLVQVNPRLADLEARLAEGMVEFDRIHQIKIEDLRGR